MNKIFIILCITLFIQACTGDGLSNAYSDITIDYIYPADGETFFPINHGMIINFNQPTNKTNLKNYTKLTRSDNAQIGFSILNTDEYNKTYVIKPFGDLAQGRDYTPHNQSLRKD